MKGGISSWFIHHPVATALLTFGVILLGVFAYPRLPVAPLPQAEFPTIQVNAALPGASPETMASSVATPLEVQLSAVPGITEMTSTSGLGTTNITLQFALDKDIDTAAQEVQSAINGASGRLPNDMPNLPSWRKVNPNDSPILVLRVQSELMPLTELSDIAETQLARQISQISGVAEVNITGQRRPALRVQASPERLAAYKLTMADIRTAVQAASVNQPKGALYGEQRISTLATNDQLFDARAYADLIVAYRDGSPVHLKDVARVSNGAENDFVQAWQNGKPGVQLIIRRQPDANLVATADAILAALPKLQEQLPASVDVGVLIDRTRTIRASQHEVELTLVITVALVLVIMGLFLRQLSATVIVAVVLGVSLVATFAAMYALGFSLNNLTLVALVIAVGFVVDDAIVVVENIHRHLELGKGMKQAALDGAAEIGFTVVSITLSLIAAFIPLLFMGGVVGRLFSEFAMTVTASLLLSVIASLTVAPMLAAKFMKPMHGAAASAGSSHPNHGQGLGGMLLRLYDRTLQSALRHQRVTLALFGAALIAAIASYIWIPKGFFPEQDTAFITGSTQGAQDVSYPDMVEKHLALAQIIASDPAVLEFGTSVGAANASGAGGGNMSQGRFFIALKDRSERDVSVQGFIDRIRPKVSQIPGIQLFLRGAQDINLGGGPARTNYSYALKSSNSGELFAWAEKLTQRLTSLPQLRDVSNDLQLGASVTRLTIDRTAAARFGITTRDIDQALYDSFGQRQISEYQTEVNQYRTILEVDPAQRGDPATLSYIHLRSPLTGEMVPLSAIAKFEPPGTGPLSINHNGMFPAVNISFNLAPGTALGDAVDALNAAKAEIGMPESITGSFQGTAKAFQESLASQPLLILAALLTVYIILGVLYESFVHPLTILSTLPSAGLGAIVFLALLGFDFSIMALIGIVLLIGIVKKNGILMIDFALDVQRKDGVSPQEAIYQACLVRFRPIIMTTLAALLGGIPLMLGFGTGSELRQPLGISIVGGLIVSQVLTLYSTPVVYLTLEKFFGRRKKEAAAKAAGEVLA
jgi:HAE1 family hydrophobic/amphiphilic exporter-1